MRIALPLVAFALLAAGCVANDDGEPAAPTPDAEGAETVRPAVAVDVALVDRTPGVGLPPTTMGIEPARLELSLLVPVELTVRNDGNGVHDLVIPDLDVASDDLDPGATQTLPFTPTEAGEYEMWCTIGGDGPLGHRAQGMRGVVAVV